jgi:hypothetical protein
MASVTWNKSVRDSEGKDMKIGSDSTNPALQPLVAAGEELRSQILDFLANWPKLPDQGELPWEKTERSHQEHARTLTIETRRWFNSMGLRIAPLILHDRTFMYYALRQVEAAIRKHHYVRPYPQQGSMQIQIERESLWGGLLESGWGQRADADFETTVESAKADASEGMNTALDLARSAPLPVNSAGLAGALLAGAQVQGTFMPNTGFILMWMDKDRPELQDVSNGIKEVCALFGVQALRADDVEHQDLITEVVLQYIRGAEFLIADLSGERPNVYYEVAYAHALGKRPILYRKEGTLLHFDLSVHNVPEYKNVTELKDLLRKRLEAITGRSPQHGS